MKVLCVLFIVAFGVAGNHASPARDTAIVPVDFHHPQLDPFRSSVITERVKLYADSPVPINFHDPQLVRFISNVAPYQKSSQVTKNLVKQLVTAVKVADPASIRQVVECSLCHEHLNVDTLATLECDHTFHKACYMGYIENLPGRIRCPLCRMIVSREPGNGQSFLFKTLRLFEKKKYILPLTRLFAFSPSGIDFRDIQLVKFASSADTGGMQPGLLKTRISKLKSAVAKHDIDLLRDLLKCPICYDYFNTQTLAILECGHTMHRECLEQRTINSCPMCHTNFQEIPPASRTFLSETLEILEAKKYILPMFLLFPDSLCHVNFRNAQLVKLISSANLEQERSDYSQEVILKTASAVEKRSIDGLREVVTCPICSKPYTVKTLVTLNCHHSMHESCYMRHRLTETSSCPICHSLGPHVPLIRPNFLWNVVVLFEAKDYIRPSDLAKVPTKFSTRIKMRPIDRDKATLEDALFIAFKEELLPSIRALIECPICMERMGPTTFVMLECGHCFHDQCVSGFRCPICMMIVDNELEGNSYLRAGAKDYFGYVLELVYNKYAGD